MKLGSFTIELLSEGRFEVFQDGHINRYIADGEVKPFGIISSGASVVGINPVLVKAGSKNILLDTGLGWGLDSGSSYKDVSNIKTNLDIFGLTPADITHVVLSHLHYDHAAGSSFTNSDFKTKISFPNAAYFVHEKEWEFALSQVKGGQEASGPDYRLDDFYRLIADGKVTFLSGDATQILDGISVQWTGGHTPGHQIVHLQNNGEHAYYLGDLLSSSVHLNYHKNNDVDVDPVWAKKKKIQLLRKACGQQAILLFYHSAHVQSGRLVQTEDEQYALEEVLNL